MEYNFNIYIAKEYGLSESIMIKNFQFWILKNQANNRHEHDGSFWTYNSVKSFEKVFPFWSKSQISRILKSLVDQGALEVGNFNQSTYDKTKWYTFKDSRLLERDNWSNVKREIELPKTESRIVEIEKPIPDTNTYTKQYTKPLQEDQDPPIYGEFVKMYFDWITDRIGVPPQHNGQEGKAAKQIIKYMKGISDDPLVAWAFVLKNFDRVEPFLQKQIKLSQLNSNLTNILNQIKNGQTTNQKGTQGLEDKIRARQQSN